MRILSQKLFSSVSVINFTLLWLIYLLTYSYAVDSHSFPFPFTSFGLIPIPIGFLEGYSHSHPIPKHVLRHSKVQETYHEMR